MKADTNYHFFASQLIAQSKSAAYVRDQMGHSGIKVTFDTYGHVSPDLGKKTSARHKRTMADAMVRPDTEGGVSNPSAMNRAGRNNHRLMSWLRGTATRRAYSRCHSVLN